MKPNEPIGKIEYAPFLFRLTLGSYFVIAGLMKLRNVEVFIQAVKDFGILPFHVATLYGTLLPYIEVAVGVLLIIGMWMTLSSLIASLLLLSFTLAIGVFPNSNELFNKDIILLGGALSLLFSGAGALSIDGFRKSG